MIDEVFNSYRTVADAIEDEYFAFKLKNNLLERRIEFLGEKLLEIREQFGKVCVLSLLAQELATYETTHNKSHVGYGSASEIFDQLYMLANFDPLALIACASYHLYDMDDANRAVRIGLYASFVAEHFRVYVRHAHQTLFRAACRARDFGIAEASLRRIVEYMPSSESPDPNIERDVVELVEANEFDADLKRAFFELVSGRD